MMDSSVAEELTRLSEAEMLHILEGLDPHEVAGLKRNWGFWGRTTQRAPEGGWRVWLMMAGRGFGKTRAGAEWVRSIAESDGSARIALVGATLHEARRSEEHTSELQSLMRNSYAVFCLKTKKK